MVRITLKRSHLEAHPGQENLSEMTPLRANPTETTSEMTKANDHWRRRI